MKTTITVEGQVRGKQKIFKQLVPFCDKYAEYRYCYLLNFASVKDAKEAIKKAYLALKLEDPTVYKSKDHKLLTYDAGEARLTKLTKQARKCRFFEYEA